MYQILLMINQTKTQYIETCMNLGIKFLLTMLCTIEKAN